MNHLHDRIIEISKNHHLAHLGSSLTSVDIINDIYQLKKEDEPFILSCGHAGLALYVILENYYGFDAEKLYLKHGTHPHRDLDDKIYCSTGSLGMGLGIAVGMALADRTKNVYCLVSDGEMFEGSIYEAANVIRKYSITNLKVYFNVNRFSAYDKVEDWMIWNIIHIFPLPPERANQFIKYTNVEDYGLTGLSAHYITL
jgi:transketolase